MSGKGNRDISGLVWSLGNPLDFDLEFGDAFVREETQEHLLNRIHLNSRTRRFTIRQPFGSGDSFWFDDRAERIANHTEICLTWSYAGGELDDSEEGGYLYKDRTSTIWQNDQSIGAIGPTTTGLGLTTAYEYILCACQRDNKTLALLSSGRLILSLSDFLSGNSELYENSYINITLPITLDHYRSGTQNILTDLGLAWTELAHFAFSQDGNKILAYKIDHYYNELINSGNDPSYLYTATTEHQPQDWETSQTYERPTIFEWTALGGWSTYWTSAITNTKTEVIVNLDQFSTNPYPLINTVYSPILGANFPLGSDSSSQIKTHEGYEANRSYIYNEDILICADYVSNEIRALIVNVSASGTHYRKQLTERRNVTWALASYDTLGSFIYYRDDWDSGEPHTSSRTTFTTVWPCVEETGVSFNDTTSSETIDVTFSFLGEGPFLTRRIVDVQDSVDYTLNSWGKPMGDDFIFKDYSFPESYYDDVINDPYYGVPWNWHIRTNGIHPVYLNPTFYGVLKKCVVISNPSPETATTTRDRTGTFQDIRVVPFLYYPTYIDLGRTTMRKWNYTYLGTPGFYYLGKPDTSVQSVMFNGQILFSREHEWEISPMWLDYGSTARGHIYYNNSGEPVDEDGVPIPNTFSDNPGETIDNWPYSAWMGTVYLTGAFAGTPAPPSGGGVLADFLGPVLRSFYLTKFEIKRSKFNSILATIRQSDDIYWDKGDLIDLLDIYLTANGLTQSIKRLANIRVV